MKKNLYSFNIGSTFNPINFTGKHLATSWQIADVPEFGDDGRTGDRTYIKFESLVNTSALKTLSFYVEDYLEPYKDYYLRAKFHSDSETSNVIPNVVLICTAGSEEVQILGIQREGNRDATSDPTLISQILYGMKVEFVQNLRGFTGGRVFPENTLVQNINYEQQKLTLTQKSLFNGAYVFKFIECFESDWSSAFKFDSVKGTWAILDLDPEALEGGQPQDITVQATNSATFEVTATITDNSVIFYQWQLRNAAGTFQNIPGETASTLTFTNVEYPEDNQKTVRCIISSQYNQQITTESASLTVTPSIITILTNPTDFTGVNGQSATFIVTAQLDTPGTLVYQWQKREFLTEDWINISGATSSSYTTPALSESDSGDSYRCKISEPNAIDVFSDAATIITYAYDLYVSPAVSGRNNWIFATHGSLILDSNSSTSYTIVPYTNQNRKIKMWGKGTSSANGGYAEGSLAFTAAQNYLAQVNVGGGSAGTSYGWVSRENGGGYAGLFSGTSASRTAAIIMAGGAGGKGFGHGSSGGGDGGGTSGNKGANSSDTQIGSTGGNGGTQSSGGSGGGAGGQSGSALQGGRGGDGVQQGYPNAGGGGGGGGGYYGGGGGGGGNDAGSSTRNASGGGGGSGYVSSSVTGGFLVTGLGNQSDSNRGTGGQSTARIIIESLIEGPFQAVGSLTTNPALTSSATYGWYTRSGGPESSAYSGIRQLVIKWNGTVIYNGSSSIIAADGSVTIGGFKYTPGTYRPSSAYGWPSNGTDLGPAGSGSGDFCNAFDISRTS